MAVPSEIELISEGAFVNMLGLDDIRDATCATYAFMKDIECPVFDGRIPLNQWYDEYIGSQPNMVLIEDNGTLPAGTNGVVIKERDVQLGQKMMSSAYLVIVAQEFNSELERVFTIAHEIAHVLMHGPILSPGMAVQREAQAYYQRNPHLDNLMEVQANVSALFSVIPSSVVELCRSKFENDDDAAIFLRLVVSSIFGCHVDDKMITERIFVEDLLSPSISRRKSLVDFFKVFRSRPSWVMDGTVGTRSSSSTEFQSRFYLPAIQTLGDLVLNSVVDHHEATVARDNLEKLVSLNRISF